MSKTDKYFVFQAKQDGTQVEVGRKVKGPGRPPIGPNIMQADDGNIYITGVLTEEPKDVSSYIEVELEDSTIWYKKQKSVSKNVTRKYELVNGKLVDQGVAGRGRPAKGFVKIEEDLVIDGINLNGHLYNDNAEEVVDEVDDEYEVVVEDEIEVEDDLEAQAMADAAADFAADGGEFEEVEFEEEIV